MENLARDYFFYLFQSNGMRDPSYILSGIQSIISNEMNFKLLAPYIVEEVNLALKYMTHTKAFGNDGFPTLFF